ncbi:MAG: GNAT family N-acetyltransferase [Bacilli bacterium]|nr:GNAT family N-acetyltransferase [Bacilli bacterium]
MDIVVRKYEESDYEGASRLLKEAFDYEKSPISDQRVHEFVACMDRKIVGYFNLMEEVDVIRNFKIFHVGYVCVDSTCRGQGIGNQMMQFAITYATEKGGARMELTSGNQRVAAHKLYLSLGFVKRDTTVFRKELL